MLTFQSTNRRSILRAAAVLLILAGFAALIAGAVSAAPRQQAVVDICGRTQAVQDAILARTGGTCSTVTDVQLAGISGAAQSLRISGYSSATLLSSDFAGLTGVTVVHITSSPTLRTVPADAFDELTKTGVTDIRFLQTGVRTLTAGVFSGFTGLTTLYLSENELVTLDVNVFAGLSALTNLDLRRNGLETLPEDIFEDLSSLTKLDLTGNQLRTLPAGAFNGLTDLVRLYLHGNRLTALDADLFDPLDDSLSELNLRQNSLTSLPEDVFDGLTGLLVLTLQQNSLTTLPEDVFDDLTGLRVLNLQHNSLTTLHEDVFDGLTGLTHLLLHSNSLTTLHEDIFDGLTSLQLLSLSSNALTTLETDVFDPLGASLTDLYLHRNSLTTLHEDIFDGLTSLTRLYLSDNALTTLATDVFDPLDDSLTALYLHRNSLTTLHQDIFDGLSDLEQLSLSDNALSTLATDVFDPLDDSLTSLYLHRNSLTTLHQDIFDGLTGLEQLYLNGNSLTTLHQDIFDPLDDSLTILYLHNNGLTTLQEDIFDGLTGLEQLVLSDNALSTLATDVFDPLDDSLKRIYLHNNSLSALPADILDGLTGLQYLDLSCNTLTAAGMPLDRFDPVASSLLFLDLDSNSFTTANPLDAAGLRAKLTALKTLYYEGTQTICLSSNNTDMSGLAVNAGALTPAFEEPGMPATSGGYSVVVAHDVTSIEVNPVAKAANASVKCPAFGTDTGSGGCSFDLRPGKANNLYWDIVAEDKVTKTEYSVLVFRAFDTPGVIVSKSSLTINEGSNGTYTVRLNTVPSGNVTVTPGSNNADVTVSPSTLTFTTVDWNTPQTVTITAAQDGDTVNDTATVTHTVSGYGTVTTAESVTVTVVDNDEPSTDATLSALTVSEGTLHGFPDSRPFVVGVANSVTSIDVTPTVSDDGATITVNTNAATSGIAHTVSSLAVGRNTVTVLVTAEDTTTTETYTVHVERGVTTDYGWKAADDLNGLYAAGNTTAADLWSNETTMWVADIQDDNLYAYALSDGTRQTVLDIDPPAGNDNPQGIWSDGDTMWVADFDDTKLYAYALSGGARQANLEFNLDADNNAPGGLWSDGTTMWVADVVDHKLYAYALFGGARQTSLDFSLHADNDAPRGIWSDGVTLWVSDFTDKKLYAYKLTPGADFGTRDSGRDFNTMDAAGNDDPYGIWSNGTTMWVANDGSNELDKVFSYNMPPPGLGIADASADEGEAITFTVTLGLGASGTVTVQYATSGGTATEDTDYTAASGTLTFNPGETTKTITVQTTDDTTTETDETFTVTLSNPTGDAAISDATATGTIKDNDEPSLSIADASAAEGDNLEFTVTLGLGASGMVTVDYATSVESTDTATEDTDYTAASGSLTFNAGETTKTITVQTTSDSVADDGETFTVTLSNASSNATISVATATGTITERASTTTVSVDWNATTKTIDVSWSDADTCDTPSRYVIYFASRLGGVVANVKLGDVAATETSFSKTVTSATLDFTIKVYCGNATPAPSGRLLAEVAVKLDTSGTYTPNAAPTFTSGTTFSVAENQTAVGTVTATDADTGDDIAYSLPGGVDRAKFNITDEGVLTFVTAPDYETPTDVESMNPANQPGNNEYVVTVEVTSGTGDRAMTATQTITVTVTDVVNEAALPVISIAAGTSPIKEHLNAQFTLSRTGSTAATLAVTVTVTETGAMLPASEEGEKTVTFGINSATATLTADVANDSVYEADSTVTATVKTGVTGYAVHATNGSADVTVNDNDPPETTVTLTVPSTPVEENVGTFNVTVTATTARDEPLGAGHAFNVRLVTLPDTAVAIHDFTTLSKTVSFRSADFTRGGAPPVWSAQKTFAVTVVDDADEEAAETFELKLQRSSGLPSAVTVDTTEHEVTIAKSDAAAPELLADPHGVVVDGATLTLTYNEDLDGAADSTPPATAYTLVGTAATVTAVSVSGRTVTLTLSAAPAPTDTVTLTYTVPTEVAGTSGPVRDLIGEEAAAISSKTVAPPDTTAPQPTITLVASTSGNRDFKLLISFGEAVTRFEKGAIELNDAWLIEEPQISPMLIDPVPDEDPDTPGNYSVPIFPSPDVAGLTVPLNVTIAAAVVQDKATPTPNDSLAGELAIEAVYTGPATFISQVNTTVASGDIKIEVYFLDNYISARPVTGFEASDIMVHNGSVKSLTKVPPRYRHDDGAHQAGDDFQGAFTGHLLFEATITPDAGCGTPTPPCTVTVDVDRGAATSATFTQAYWDHLKHPGPGLPDAASVDPGHTPRPNFKANTLTVQREATGTNLYVRALALYRDPNNFAYRASFLMDQKNQTLRKTHFDADNAALELIGDDEPRELWEFWAEVAADGNVVLKVDRDLDGDHDTDDYTYTITDALKTLPVPPPPPPPKTVRAARSAGGKTAKSQRAEAAQAVEIPDAALRAILEALLGKQAGDAITTADLATVVSLNLRDSGVAALGGLQHAVNLTDLYLEDFSLDLAPLQGLGLFVHVPGEEPLWLPSSDATLSGLTLSGVNIGAFDPATTGYTAGVAHDVTETTVTATANDVGATYAAKLDGAADADGTVTLAVGDNVITVEVTAEDGQTTRTYTVTVTRAGPPLTARFEEVPATHNGTDPFTFRIAFSEPISSSYVTVRDHSLEVTGGTVAAAGRVDGRNDLWWVRVQPDSDADVTIALPANRACDTQGAVCTADGKVLSNRPELTVPGPQPTLSTDATLSGLALSGVDIGAFDPATTDYTASVGNDVTETTVTATANDEGATYVIKLDGAADADGTVELAVGANVITVEVTAEDGQTTKTYTVTVNRAGTPLTAEFQEAPATHNGTDPFTFRIAFSEAISTSYVVVRDHFLEVTGGTVAAAGRVDGRNDLWWVRVEPDSDADVTIALPANRACDTQGAVCTADEKALSNRLELTVPGPQPTLSSDATLSGLALSDVNIGTFGSATTQYTASVANSVTETTVTPTANDGGATYVVKLDGVEDGDGTVALAVGANVITVEITAEDGNTVKTYTVTVTRAEAPPPASSDATLSGLALGGVDIGTFDPATTEYTADVGHDVTETTVTATANDGATYGVKLGGVADADRVIPLAVGANVITIVVTAEDGQATRTYSVTVTRAEAPPSDDATLSGLTLSGVNFGAFNSATTEYTTSVGNDVTETTVTATANDGGATYAMKLDGVADSDGTVPLAEGSNVITIEVTAEDGQTTKTYTVTVTRAAPPPSDDATLSGLTLSGVNIGTFDSTTTDYTAEVGHDVTETTVTATANDVGATYVVNLDGTEDADGTVDLAVGANAITIEVTTEDGNTVKTYTVTVTRAAPPPSDDATLSGLTLSSVNIGTFDSATTDYTADVGHDVTETTVTATANDVGATYMVNLDGTEDADGTVDLAVGANAITIEVTAEDGNTVKTYTVTVTRAAPTAPSASVTVTLSPRPEQYSTGTDITIEWTDSDACGSEYFVGVYDNEELEVVVRVLGFHPAPATTTLSADLGLPWDSISSNDWWVGVTCTSEWTLVGKASLQSGLPSDSENE